MKTIELYEGPVLHTLEQSTRIANYYTKGCDAWGNPWILAKSYHTALKEQPAHPAYPEYCWRVTNRFDPRVKGE